MPVAEAAPDEPVIWYVTDDEEHAQQDPTVLGFWIYLMSDALIFAALFATFGVLSTSYAGGPVPREIFDLRLVAVNSGLLLLSSLTFGGAMLAQGKRGTLGWLVVTAMLGAAFVGVELYEFSHLIGEGATPQRSAFLSSFFVLVGTHGLHVTVGLVWIGVLLVQIARRGLEVNRRRLVCLAMFWHFLDIIWIGVFTFVYLFGMLR